MQHYGLYAWLHGSVSVSLLLRLPVSVFLCVRLRLRALLRAASPAGMRLLLCLPWTLIYMVLYTRTSGGLTRIGVEC